MASRSEEGGATLSGVYVFALSGQACFSGASQSRASDVQTRCLPAFWANHGLQVLDTLVVHAMTGVEDIARGRNNHVEVEAVVVCQ